LIQMQRKPRICPLIYKVRAHPPQGAYDCLMERCEWWISGTGQMNIVKKCALAAIADALQRQASTR
jgi:hypothetical protein